MTVTSSPANATTARPAPPRRGRGLVVAGALGMAAGVAITVAVVSLPGSGARPTPAGFTGTGAPGSAHCIRLPHTADAAEHWAADARLRDSHVRFC